MAKARLVRIEPSLGILPKLRSSQPAGEQRVWTAVVHVLDADVGPGRLYRLHVSAQDLNGTTLFPFASSASLAAPFNKRTNVNPIQDPTVDSLHRVPLAL